MSTRIMRTAFLMFLAAFVLGGCGRGQESASSDHEEHEESEHTDHTTIAKDTADEVGIRTAPVGSGIIRDAHEVQGLLTPVEGRHARIRARFPGPIQAVHVGVGDQVRKGQRLAVIESNVSLAPYDVTAPFAGTILDVEVGTGDLAGDEPLFELADLSSLWVDLHLFGGDAQHITPGLPVTSGRVCRRASRSSRFTIARLSSIAPSPRFRRISSKALCSSSSFCFCCSATCARRSSQPP